MTPDCAEHPLDAMKSKALSDPHLWTEEELVRAAQEGDNTALNELLRRYRHLVHGALRRYAGSHDETEDLVQDVMLRAYRNISQFRGNSRFPSWLIAIGINVAISARRKACRVHWVSLDEPKCPEDQSPAFEPIDHQRTPEQSYVLKERRELLQRKLGYLSPKYRSILMWTDIDGLPLRSTANALGIPLGTAKSRLRRARHMLHDSLRCYIDSPRRSNARLINERSYMQKEAR